MKRKKPDNRNNNVERIQRNIDMTIKNYELGKEMIQKTSDQKLKKDLNDKNQRRLHALEGMREEIKDEAAARNKGYRK